MSPVRPSQVKELVINPSDLPCDAWKKLLKSLYLFYLLIRYENAADGLVADAHGADLCAIECPDT